MRVLYKTLLHTHEGSVLLAKMDTIFTPQDVSFIIEQVKDQSDFRLKQELTRGKRVISTDTLKTFGNVTKKKFRKKIKSWNALKILSVSQPYFSKDETKAVVRMSYYTDGGESGETLLLVKENGAWKYTQQLYYWEY